MTLNYKVKEMRKIPLKDLVIGKGQVRKRHVSKDISELAESIKAVGQLNPIVVCPHAEQPGKFEIIIGQRRFLAIKSLGQDNIWAAIMDRPMTEAEVLVLSLTASSMRQKVTKADIIDVCTLLYRLYGDIKIIAQKTGLPPNKIRDYIKYDSLIPELKKLVDSGGVDIQTALRAQEALEKAGEVKPDVAVTLTKKLKEMIGAQQKKVAQKVASGVATTVEEINELIEDVKKRPTLVELSVVLDQETSEAIVDYAKGQGMKQEDVIQSLIRDILKSMGYLELKDEE